MTITAEDLRMLRCAATLADVAPSTRLSIRDSDRVLFHVARDSVGRDVPTWHPDEFRASLARSHRSFLLGNAEESLELLPEDPAIDIWLNPGDAALPGGIYRLGAGDQHLHLLLSTLSPSACHRALDVSFGGRAASESELFDGICGSWPRVGLHFDRLTKVTAVHAFARVEDADMAHRAMAAMLEVLVVAEIFAEMGAVAFEDGPKTQP